MSVMCLSIDVVLQIKSYLYFNNAGAFFWIQEFQLKKNGLAEEFGIRKIYLEEGGAIIFGSFDQVLAISCKGETKMFSYV